MSEPPSSAYDDTHRAFLQCFLSLSTLTFTTAQPLLSSILSASSPDPPASITRSSFDAYIAALNAAISPFDLEIRSAIPQTAAPQPERVYALVNTTSDPAAQLGTTHSADEIAFLKRVLDGMFVTHNTRRAEVCAIAGLQALALARGPGGGDAAQAAAGLSKAEAERVLESLVAEGWLVLSRGGYYALSARALMELRTWLVETYNGEEGDEDGDGDRIKFCAGCRDIVVVGQRCGDLECEVRVHEFCLRNVLRAAGGGDACPGCRRAWTGDSFVGEKAAAVRRRTTGASAVNGNRRASEVVDGDGDSDSDE